MSDADFVFSTLLIVDMLRDQLLVWDEYSLYNLDLILILKERKN